MSTPTNPTNVTNVLSYRDPRVGPPLTILHNGVSLHIGRPPSVKQWAFINRSEMEQLYGGSKSGGKTRALCAKLILLATSFPGNQLGLFRKDLTDLKGSTLVTFEQMCPRELIIQHHKTDHYYWIRTSSPQHPTRIWYGGLGEASDFESAKGKEYGAFAIDEPSEVDMQAYLQMLGQLRWTLPEGFGNFDKETGSWRPPYQAILGSNPEPGWLEDHFGHLISNANDVYPVVTDKQRVYIMALPKDNPYLPPNWETVLRNQADIPESWVKKYLEGSWEASEGLVFKEFDRRVHLVKFTDLPPAYLASLKLYGSLDHATTGITCFTIVGADAWGNLIVLGSHYKKDQLISKHAEQIKSIMDQWVTICGKKDLAEFAASNNPGSTQHWSTYGFEYLLIDPSTQAKTLQDKNEMWSVMDMYMREGIPVNPAWNALETGVSLLEEYVHVKPNKLHPFKQQHGSPSLFIVEDFNKDGIKELVSWKKTITVNQKTRFVGKDHWIDNVRYIAMSRPEPPEFFHAQIMQPTHDQMAEAAMQKFDAKFGKAPNAGQWFPGGSGKSNQWFPKPN